MSVEDKDRLNRAVKKSLTRVFKDSLAFIEMSGVDSEKYARLRKMILRSGNDEIRKISEELEKYDVTYTPDYNEQIEFDEKK